MHTLCIDFDGVIHNYISGWQKVDTIPDPPVPGAMDFLRLATQHFKVSIYSARTARGGTDAMQRYVHDHLYDAFGGKIAMEVFDLIEWPEEKPSAWLTLDDRALTFTGEWPTMETLNAFKPWNYDQRQPRWHQYTDDEIAEFNDRFGGKS